MKFRKTARGFALLEFSDRYGEWCSIQKSSLATEDAIWVGLDQVTPKIMAKDVRDDLTGWINLPLPEGVHIGGRMHLTKDQAREVAQVLLSFAETGEINEP